MSDAEDPLENTAPYWFARMNSGEVNGEDEAAFRNWLAADPRHTDAYRVCQFTWAELGVTAGSRRMLAMRAEALREASHGAPTRRSVLRQVAAGVTLTALGGTGAWWGLGLGGRSYATEAGERLTTVLPDRTEMILAPRSRLRLDFSEDVRLVTLRRGQAFFNVARDFARPFQVAAHNRVVTAMDTQFQVTLRGDTAEVFVLEGSVTVALAGGTKRAMATTQRVAPGQRLSGRLKTTQIETADAKTQTAWLSGRLVFQDEALTAVVEDFNRYSADRLQIADPAVGAMRVSGSFRYDGAGDFAEVLHNTLGLRVERTGESTYRIDRGA